MPKGYIFISSPYSSHGHPPGSYDAVNTQDMRYQATQDFVAWCFQTRKHVFSPIVHCHAVAKRHTLPVDAAFWKDYNETMLWNADAIYVLRLSGWNESTGVKWEIDMAYELGLKRFYADPAHSMDLSGRYKLEQF